MNKEYLDKIKTITPRTIRDFAYIVYYNKQEDNSLIVKHILDIKTTIEDGLMLYFNRVEINVDHLCLLDDKLRFNLVNIIEDFTGESIEELTVGKVKL